MVQKNLVDYLFSQIKKGKSVYEVKDFLINSGYDKAEVESSVEYVINLWKNPQIAEQQRIQQLSYYIQEQIHAGYNLAMIKKFLVSRGYPFYEIENASKLITQPAVEHKIEHKLIVVALIAMIMMTGVLTFFYAKSFLIDGIPSQTDQLLDVKAEKITTLVIPGEDLVFKVDLINLGEANKFDVELKYSVIDRDLDKVVLSQSESVAIVTSTQRAVVLEIPADLKPGDYVLRADAFYGEQIATSGFIFEIKSGDEADKIVQDVLDKFKPVNESEKLEQNLTDININTSEPVELDMPVLPDTSIDDKKETESDQDVPIVTPEQVDKEDIIKGLSKAEATEIIKQVSTRDFERAVDMCKSFTYEGTQNNCLIELAGFNKDEKYCDEIDKETYKDSCYTQLVFEHQKYELCDQVNNPKVKQSCGMFKQLNNMQQAVESGDNEQAKKLAYSLM
ncbi:hypothetical protein HOK51_11255 [Candidatus Woesearchaeota archaeon]|jgi:hypothetical protein|nr:hypothetical protein [Candidatus Woesearchaeota archaeon]MBT6520400.1 hypothetical protein [Candidatus Woesearchaeota archaeon]MBT7368926.1 hypothetical protein [Candidatus Woesearchaeota archaeon]